MSRQVCKTCGKSLYLSKFRLLVVDPPKYSKECIHCLAQKKTAGDSFAARVELSERIQLEEKVTQEMASREMSRRSLIHYTERFEKNYSVGWFHQDVARRLQKFIKDVEDKKSPRLMLMAPPRAGKSKLVSENLASYVLGHYPDWEIINASYAVSLPIVFSKRIRERMRSQEYRGIFQNVQLDDNNQGVEGWGTKQGGGYLPAGVGGSLTGKGAHILVIDDPLKDREEADSEIIRRKVIEWYSSVAYTRLYPGAGILIMMTRWHDADLIGHLLEAEAQLRREGAPAYELENWEVVKYPAIAEEEEFIETPKGRVKVRSAGDPLHPERFDLARLLRIKRNLIPRDWTAMYQQDPVPSEGELFKKDYIRYYNEPIDFSEMTPIIAGDLAIGTKQLNDFTVVGIGYLNHNGDVYVPTMIRARMGTFEIAQAIASLVARYKPLVGYIERGQISMAVMPVLQELLDRQRSFVAWDEDLKPTTDKVSRARPLQGMMQQGRVFFPAGQPWVDTAIHELLRFPSGVHDDVVDFLAWLIHLARKTPPPRIATRPKPLSWRDKLGAQHGSRPKSYLAA